MPPDQKHKNSYNYMQGCLELLLKNKRHLCKSEIGRLEWKIQIAEDWGGRSFLNL